MARVMQFPSAFPQGTGQEQGAQARAQAQLMQGSILGNLLQNLSGVATDYMEKSQEAEKSSLLLDILEPILKRGAAVQAQAQQPAPPPQAELPSYARNLPQLEMPAEAMGLDVSSLKGGQEAMSALIEAGRKDPSILRDPLTQSIIQYGMTSQEPTKLIPIRAGDRTYMVNPYTSETKAVFGEQKADELEFQDLGEEIGVFNKTTKDLIRTEPKIRPEKEEKKDTVRIPGWRDGKPVVVVYDKKDWSEVTVLPTGEPPKDDRAPVQWIANLKARQNYFKEAAKGGVYVHMWEDPFEGPKREKIEIENEGRLRELMKWQNVDPETPEGQEILELYRNSGKFLVQEGLTDTEESRQHVENQEGLWDKFVGLIGLGGKKDEEVKVIRGGEGSERSAEDVTKEPAKREAPPEGYDSNVALRVQQLKSQGVEDSRIKKDLIEIGIDPAIYGL
jgi:hypothetical protein